MWASVFTYRLKSLSPSFSLCTSDTYSCNGYGSWILWPREKGTVEMRLCSTYLETTWSGARMWNKKKQYNMLYITQSAAGLLINKTFTVQSCHISTLPFPKVYVDEVRLHQRVRGEEGRHAATLYPGVHYVWRWLAEAIHHCLLLPH